MASGGSTNTTVESMLTGEQRILLHKIIGQIMPQVGEGIEAYGGQITPGISSLMQQGLDQLGGAFSGESGGALSQMLSGESAYQVDPAAREKLYASQKAMGMRQFQSEIMPMLEERYAAGGGRSGGLEHAMGQAGGDLSLGLNTMYAGLGYQDEQARRMGLESAAGRQGQGLGLWGNMAGGQIAGGELTRNIEGQQLGEQYNTWLAQQPYMNPYLTQWAPMAFGVQPYALGSEGKQVGILS